MAAAAFAAVSKRVVTSAASAGRPGAVRLVAVSKLKPNELLREVYDCGQRHFGENYVQELVTKAPELPDDIRWHFIGQLQSNKARLLVSSVPNLWAVESVDSIKLARKLDAACAEHRPADGQPLNVYVQVNTSAEPQKGGVEPSEAASLALFIQTECPTLALRGLMTIGKLGSPAEVYFERLVAVREAVSKELGMAAMKLELSMGMSADFEMAIGLGADSVRVGSSIFGERLGSASASASASGSATGSASAPAPVAASGAAAAATA